MEEQMPVYTKQGSISGSVAMVTGAAGTLGRATVESFVRLGLKVVMVDISAERLKSMAEEFGDNVYPLFMDLSKSESIESAFQTLPKEFSEISILINNAGILTNHKSHDTSMDEWRQIMEINLNGVFCLTKLVIPGMKNLGWGRIVNTSSLAAKSGGITAGTAYSTSKGAVISLTFSLAAELAAYGITVNGIAPAYVKTPMVTEQLSEAQREDILKKIPVGRFCEADEFAHVVNFLIDDQAGFITGEIVDQNGGLLFD